MYSDVDCFENIIFDVIRRINLFFVDKKIITNTVNKFLLKENKSRVFLRTS